MTYLTLCQDLARECDIAGASASAIPTAVTNQVGELKRVVEWVKNAWIEIQNRHQNWRWLRSRWSVNTVAADDTYAGTDCTDARLGTTIDRFGNWIPFDDCGYSNVKSYLSSGGVGGEGWLIFLPWEDFRSIYKIGTQNNNKPAHFTIDPQNNLVLGPAPEAVYVVSGEYQMSAQILAANADVPGMPSQFHQLIVYWAMRKYSGFDASVDVMARAIDEGNKLLRQLENNQLPGVGLARPLA